MKRYLSVLLLAGGLALAGCGDSQEDYVFTGNIPSPSPIARNDAYNTNEDTPLAVPAATGVLVNDSLNTNGAVTVAFPATTTQGGTITGGANDGSFTYTPAAGFAGADTFSYTLSNGFGSSTATVTVTVADTIPNTGFFVDATNGNDATGDFNTGAPYATIQAAVAAAPTNAIITVRPGTYAGGITLKNGQQLLGVASGTRPVLTGTVTLGDGNTIDFLRFQGTNGNAIDGDDQNGGIITNCQFANIGNIGSAIRIQSVTGSWTIEDNIVNDVTGIGIDATTGTGDAGVFRINGNTVTNCDFAAVSFVAAGNGTMRMQLNDNAFADNAFQVTVEIITGDTADAVFQIVGNTNDDVYRFSRNVATSHLRVERLEDLETLNTGSRLDSPGSQTPETAANGDAGFGVAIP